MLYTKAWCDNAVKFMVITWGPKRDAGYLFEDTCNDDTLQGRNILGKVFILLYILYRRGDPGRQFEWMEFHLQPLVEVIQFRDHILDQVEFYLVTTTNIHCP